MHVAPVRSVEKGSHFGKRPQTLEPSYRPNLCHHLLGVGGGLEAEHTRILANAGRQCYSGWRFVERRSSTVSPGVWKCKHGKEQLGIRSVRAWRKVSSPILPRRPGLQLIKEGNVKAAGGAINEPRLLADGSIPNQIFCVRCDQRTLATRKHELWECTSNRLINRGTHERFRPPCDTGAGILGHRSSFVCPWPFAA